MTSSSLYWKQSVAAKAPFHKRDRSSSEAAAGRDKGPCVSRAAAQAARVFAVGREGSSCN